MPPISKRPKDLTFRVWSQHTANARIPLAELTEVQFHHHRNDRDAAAVTAAYKPERRTGSEPSVYDALDLSSSLIICAVLIVWLFALLPTFTSNCIRKVKRHHQEQPRGRSKSTQEVLPAQRFIHSQSRGPSVQARAATDLSQQQGHLARRLSQLQTLLEQERRAAEALAVSSRVRTMEATHLRDREQEWEQYRLRSNQGIISGFERLGSIIHQMQWNDEERQLDVDSRMQFPTDFPPSYLADDRAPPYTPR
ncbi:MAG: hypothetical protein LQ352_002289 [Teloschistes flavicans]|nr:MAG: hypothetical protein LQ352_002289 [Teloschistes flavicans]